MLRTEEIQSLAKVLDVHPGVVLSVRIPALADILQEHYGSYCLDNRTEAECVAIFILRLIAASLGTDRS